MYPSKRAWQDVTDSAYQRSGTDFAALAARPVLAIFSRSAASFAGEYHCRASSMIFCESAEVVFV